MEEVLAAFLPILIGRVTDSEKKPSMRRTRNPVTGSNAFRRSPRECGTIHDQSWTPNEARAKATMMAT
jgi:hypothetical protein